MGPILCVCVRVRQSVCLWLVDVGLIQDAMAAVCYNYLGADHTHKRTHTRTHISPDYLIRRGLSD